MTESNFRDPTQQLILEMRRRVRDLEEQNANLRRTIEELQDALSENFTPPDDDPR